MAHAAVGHLRSDGIDVYNSLCLGGAKGLFDQCLGDNSDRKTTSVRTQGGGDNRCLAPNFPSKIGNLHLLCNSMNEKF